MNRTLLYLNIYGALWLLAGCQNYDSSQYANVGLNTDPEAEYVSDEELSISIFLDLYAGHPFDQKLPESYLGVDDDELEETNGHHIRRVLTEGLVYARSNLNSPRYMFAVARTAYLVDHDSAGVWLNSAAQSGSVAAKAYLGYYELDLGNARNALDHMQQAKEAGFTDPTLSSIIRQVSESIFDSRKFNRPNLINALYNQQLQYQNDNEILTSLYVGAIHNTLWSNDILFIIDDPEIFLKLDAGISAREGLQADNIITNKLKQLAQAAINIFNSSNGPKNEEVVIIEYGIQDARRLAIMYENNPRALEKVYAGMVAYSKRSN